nr:DUF488 domain-containing protein [Comamonas sp. NLF-1-9]
MVKLPFFSVGHSTHSLEEFVALLRGPGVQRVVDIRSLPGSRRYPQFNREALAEGLAQHGLDYEHVALLGGLRSKTAGVPRETNAWWENASFHRYADYACTPAFADGLAHLIELGRKQRCAMMCSEVLWWRCHRRIVTDHLLARDETVWHIMPPDKLDAAHLSAGALVGEGASITYPAVSPAPGGA